MCYRADSLQMFPSEDILGWAKRILHKMSFIHFCVYLFDTMHEEGDLLLEQY